ncbi:serrate RNA effector molecule homolog [Anser cygnoides]|uniref:serrate RNA effector molecule homolog n=1 Tax=Anser cygnoides TaxID=8845 RepID=UPI0034D1DDF8
MSTAATRTTAATTCPTAGGTGPTYGPPQPWGHPEMHVMQHHILPIQASRLGNIAEVDLGMAPPVMKSFKEFLLSLDDAVDETEAVKRYNDYKLDFRRQQMQDFFLAHKDEECNSPTRGPAGWRCSSQAFRSKYHPDEAGRRKQEAQAALRNRLNVFLYLSDNGWFDNLLLDIDRANAIVKTLDAAVIKMEGGTENDLRILEQEEEEERQEKAEAAKKDEPRPPEADRKAPEEKEEGKKGEGEEPPRTRPRRDRRRRRRRRGGRRRRATRRPRRPARSGSGSAAARTATTRAAAATPTASPRAAAARGTRKKRRGRRRRGARRRRRRRPPAAAKAKEKESEPKPRPLHKTCSLFMRNIAPNISQAEIVALCKRYPGFMRVALSDPQPERRFFRRGWVTFDRSVNIKEICWSLQNIRLRDCELSPGVNRDLTRRVRNVNGITQHRAIVRNDIKLAARLVHALDGRARLWGGPAPGGPRRRRPRRRPQPPPPPNAAAAATPNAGAGAGAAAAGDGDAAGAAVGAVPSQNPVLKHITDYLIEEVSAEEEELLGRSGGRRRGPPRGEPGRGHRRARREAAQGAGPPAAVPAHRALGGLLQRLRVPQRGRDAQPLRHRARAGAAAPQPRLPRRGGRVAEGLRGAPGAAAGGARGAARGGGAAPGPQGPRAGAREVRHRQHPGAGQGQVAVSPQRQEVQGPRVRAQAHLQQARREDRGGAQGGALLQQLPARPQAPRAARRQGGAPGPRPGPGPRAAVPPRRRRG